MGQFAADASLEPFVDQVRDKLIDRFGNLRQRLGLTIDDVAGAAGGEVSLAMLHTPGERASMAIAIDVTGRPDEADELVAKIEAHLAARGAKRHAATHSGTELTVLRLPADSERDSAIEVVHFRLGELLIALDSLPQARRIVETLAGRGATLAAAPVYAETMRRVRAESRGLAPDVAWFLDPFAWDAARRTLRIGRLLPDRKDTPTILREQGFDAVRGVGGHVSLAVTPQQDFVHRTAVYAPPQQGVKTQPAGEKYQLGMRMAEFPNRDEMPLQPWAPRMSAAYTTLNLDIQNAFDHVASVFDAMSGYEGAFRHTLDSFEVDPFGPKIKVREQLVQHLGGRITIVTDYRLPIEPDSERFAIVVEVSNPAALRGPMDKLMENDGALRRTERGVAYWEVVPEDEMPGGVVEEDLLEIDPAVAPAPARAGAAPSRRSAVCLQGRQLIIASDKRLLRRVLFGVERRDSLAGSYDYQAAMRALDALAPWDRCSYSFFRTDESVRPTYELVRRGLMPQSRTFVGRVLNEMLTTRRDEERGVIRRQRIDGASLPTFEAARRYFGPAARAIRSDGDGWFITGVVLSKAGQ